MNKADEMFEELEEAIKEFEKLVKLRKNKCGEITHDTCIVSTAQLETVLKHIENSIPKKKIEEILNNKYRLFFEGDEEFPDMSTRIDTIKYIKAEVLEKLLKEK